MVTFEEMEDCITGILNHAKRESGISELGLALRRHYGSEFGIMRRYYPEAEDEGVLLYAPKKRTRDFTERVFYVGSSKRALSEEEFKRYFLSMLSKNIHRNFAGNERLRALAKYIAR